MNDKIDTMVKISCYTLHPIPTTIRESLYLGHQVDEIYISK